MNNPEYKEIKFNNNYIYKSSGGDNNNNNNNNESIENIMKNEESQLKSIVFSSNSENNQIDNIFFNNVQEDNIDKFLENNKNIIIEEEVALKDSEIIYKDDNIYLKELVTQFLSEYKVTSQESKYIQDLVEKKALDIIDIKNIGIIENDMLENGIEYKLIQNIFYDDFKSNIIIPIVSDKHKIYVKLKDNRPSNGNNENNNKINKKDLNIYFSESLEDKNGIIEENQYNQFIQLKELIHNKAISRIDYQPYLNELFDIAKPYIINMENLGYIKNSKNNSLILRYNDIDTIHWNTYNNEPEFINKKDVFDEKGKIIGQENNVLLRSTEINIIGFMILSNNNKLQKEFIEVGPITRIYNGEDGGIIINCNNHNIAKNDIIYIDNTNSFPLINSKFNSSIEIINNNLIKLNIDMKLLKESTEGTLYKISVLEYDKYEIVKNNGKLESIMTKSNKDSKNSNPNKVYLFNNLNIDKNDYENIVKMIMPSLDKIIENYKNDLNNAYTYDDVNEIFKKYNLTIDNFNINQISIIKKVLYTNLNKLLKHYDDLDKKNIILNFNKNNKKQFNSNYFLSNTYITDKDIEKIYGKYNYINKPEDNIILRFKWIESMNDNGKYYYLNFISKQKLNYNLKYISDKKKELDDLLINLKKAFNKEIANIKNKPSKMYKYQAYKINSENDLLKNKLKDDTLVFYNDELYIWKGKLLIMENIENNSLLLVDNELWVYKKNIWEKSNIIPKYDNISYLCSLNNSELSNLKIDSLDCIYRKENGCRSKLYYRLSDNIEKTKDNLEKIIELENYFKNKKEDIENHMNKIKERYFPFDDYNNIKIDKLVLENEKIDHKQNNIKDPLSLLLNLIKNIKNNSERLHYIYTLIDLDGIIINNDIYSKRYNKNMNICGHYYYLKKINYANSPEEKEKLLSEMFNIYSDDGYSEKKIHTCKNCGEYIGIIEYDDTEGFADSGMLIKSRETWIQEKETVEKIDIFEHLKISDLDETYLKDILIKQGLTIDDVDIALDISQFITNNLFQKSGVILPNQEIINIIIDSMQKLKGIIPYSIYKIKEIKKLQDKGISQNKINDFEEKGKIKESYNLYYNIRKSCIISSRFLISVQTIIPIPLRSSKNTICPFNSFDDNEGIIYISCILQEMGMIKLRDKSKGLELIKINIDEVYNDFKNMVHIKKLFKNKKIYLKELENKSVDYKFLNIDIKKEKDLIEPIEVGNEYLILLKQSKDYTTINNLYTVLVNRLLYLARIIKKTVIEVIGEFESSNIYSGQLESSCCVEDLISYINYYYFIEEFGNVKIIKYITESNKIYDFLKYHINTGTFHKYLLYDKNWFNGVHNYPIVDDQYTTSYNVILASFTLYVDKGIYTGTSREYVDTIDGQIDIKTGMTKKEIISKNYTIEEYQNLLLNIEKLNIQYYKPIFINKMDNNELSNLKQSSYQYLDNEIKKLINTIANILNKDSLYIDKYINLLRNMGLYDKLYKKEELSEKDKIKLRESMNKERLDYLKKFYISKLKKYLSIIKNGYYNNKFNGFDLSYSSNETISLELQSFIYDETQKISSFLQEDVKKYFIDINLDYTNNEINSINAMDNIYDSKYEKIKKYSEFNFNDASNVLLYIIVKQMNNIILCSIPLKDTNKNGNYEISNLEYINNKNVKCKYICNFINLLLEDIENEYIIFDECKNGSEQIDNAIRHDALEYKLKEYYKDGEDYLLKKLKREKFNPSTDYLSEAIEQAENEYIQNTKEQEQELYIIEKGKKELYDKYGYEPSENQLEQYKEDYLKNMSEELDIEKDEYNFSLDPKKDEVIDQGAGYGDLNEFDFETGDGFDYSEQELYEE
jgi:hypothetical protein